MKNIRIAIFDDNTQLRESLFDLVDASEGFICVGAFPNCENVLQNVKDTKPDVILMDIEMPVVSGIDAVILIKERFPDVKILMQTIFEDDEKVFQSICNGAEGYILKNTAPGEILSSLKEIYEGGAPMTPAIATKVLRMFKNNLSAKKDESFNLSIREKEILKHLVEGLSYKMIADACFISLETVSGHIKNIYKKLQVHSKGEAVAKAIKGNIV
ncbi:MAG TPA: response regulator transcription factor [Chitinophagaceae bacterium]|jgi:DNA-binding NarL/FixJ family response regulator|nr:response regulator transcription factor [Chitinophagaceae bacterium]